MRWSFSKSGKLSLEQGWLNLKKKKIPAVQCCVPRQIQIETLDQQFLCSIRLEVCFTVFAWVPDLVNYKPLLWTKFVIDKIVILFCGSLFHAFHDELCSLIGQLPYYVACCDMTFLVCVLILHHLISPSLSTMSYALYIICLV